MSFNVMFDILKEKEKNKILFVQCGAFYLATGEDAVILHKVLNLKCTCFKKNICKVGVPITVIEKYLEKLEKIKYAYVVYDFDKENKRLIKKYISEGKYHNERKKTINCIICKGISVYDEDEYIEAVTKLIELEN